MKRNTIFKGLMGGLLIAMLTPLSTLMLSSCSDEPDSQYFYTFTGEMMSDYLKNRPEYSEFAEIVERAGLMDLLATYGHYTCFAPSNDAVDKFLQGRGLSSVSQLRDVDCDTIARTHLVPYMYTTYEMIGHKLPAMNLLNRYLATAPGFDSDSNAVIVLEKTAHIKFDLKDDSVENGIMQPIDMVLEKSNSYISDLIRNNQKISTFYAALEATGVINDVMLVEDENYNPKDYNFSEGGVSGEYETNQGINREYEAPDTKRYGYTLFIEPDSLLEAKYGIQKGDLRALYNKACEIYDQVYPQDVNAPGHSFENLTDSVNPLRRFVQYHILNMTAAAIDDLTPQEIINYTGFEGAISIEESLVNPCDWHYTLLPHTMIKVDKVTVSKYLGGSKRNQRYINRRNDDKFHHLGQRIDPTDDEYEHDGINGHYYYVDDIVAFSKTVQEEIHNVRIRMDFNTVFPEFITNGLRILGDPSTDAGDKKYGRNWQFPEGYFDGVTFSNCVFKWRRPIALYNIYMWDEFNLFGDYDFKFRLPPVPFDGEWQIRLGFTAQATRGVAQIYLDGIPQGIPLDMTKYVDSDYYLGEDGFISQPSDYNNLTPEEKAEYFKTMKNLGIYPGPRSVYANSGWSGNRQMITTYNSSMRKIISQSYLDSSKDHYLRIRVASDGSTGNDNEFALDFIELVPKSVYGADEGGEMEDDL